MRKFTVAMMAVLVLAGCSTKAKPVATTPTTEAPPTPGQTKALEEAQAYLEGQSYSREGLIDQLSSASGENLPVADATWAVDHLDADWAAEAVQAANEYMALDSPPATCDELLSVLQNGELFTEAQAHDAAVQAENTPC